MAARCQLYHGLILPKTPISNALNNSQEGALNSGYHRGLPAPAEVHNVEIISEMVLMPLIASRAILALNAELNSRLIFLSGIK